MLQGKQYCRCLVPDEISIEQSLLPLPRVLIQTFLSRIAIWRARPMEESDDGLNFFLALFTLAPWSVLHSRPAANCDSRQINIGLQRALPRDCSSSGRVAKCGVGFGIGFIFGLVLKCSVATRTETETRKCACEREKEGQGIKEQRRQSETRKRQNRAPVRYRGGTSRHGLKNICAFSCATIYAPQ